MSAKRNRNRQHRERSAAEQVLSATHTQVSASLARMDILSAETREQTRLAATLRAQTRERTKAWFEDHPEEASALSDLFFGPDRDKSSPRPG